MSNNNESIDRTSLKSICLTYQSSISFSLNTFLKNKLLSRDQPKPHIFFNTLFLFKDHTCRLFFVQLLLRHFRQPSDPSNQNFGTYVISHMQKMLIGKFQKLLEMPKFILRYSNNLYSHNSKILKQNISLKFERKI